MVTPGGMIGSLSPPLCGIAWPSYWTANGHDWSIGIVKALLPPLCGVEPLYRAKRAWMLQRGDCEKCCCRHYVGSHGPSYWAIGTRGISNRRIFHGFP